MNLKQLAKELNLSISAVSKALRDSHEISAKTKANVLAKAKELNYQVNPFASGLRKQKSKTIAVVIPEISNVFFSMAINGIESIAQDKGYHVLIYLTHEDPQKEISIMKLLQNGRVDGILMSLSCDTKDTSHLEEMKTKEIPMVFFDRVAESIQAPQVNTNDHECGFIGTEHLIKKGCKKIAFLGLSNHLSISNKRTNGFLQAVHAHQIKKTDTIIVICDLNENENRKKILKLLKGKRRPDGIFASVEKLALIVYDVCRELDLRIPEDVKLLGFSNLHAANYLKPSLTTITQPAYEIGQSAASTLFRIIDKRGLDYPPEKLILSSVLIERDSTR
jgi:LacI family transcriptional regulator